LSFTINFPSNDWVSSGGKVNVDDVRFHISALDQHSGELLDFDCRPTLNGLIGQLEKVQEYFDGTQLQLCYEASYVGFSLECDLTDRGYRYEVVAPWSISRRGV